MEDEFYTAINTISRFLALRNLEKLTQDHLQKMYGLDKVAVLVVFGNDLPYVPAVACQAYQAGLCDYLLMCGGVGHSTEILKKKLSGNPLYANCNLQGGEGEIFAEIARKIHRIPADRILVENRSANCSENGQFALQVLRERGIGYPTMVLLQDPLLQYRSYISMKQYLPEETLLISYAPFIPEMNRKLEFDSGIEDLWSKERFYELLMGEIWRLRDDEKGYGPQGKNYFEHVDIPHQVETSYELLLEPLKKYLGRCG